MDFDIKNTILWDLYRKGRVALVELDLALKAARHLIQDISPLIAFIATNEFEGFPRELKDKNVAYFWTISVLADASQRRIEEFCESEQDAKDELELLNLEVEPWKN